MLILLPQKPFSYFEQFGILIMFVTNCVTTLSCQNKLTGLFSNSLINLEVKQRKSLTVMLFGYLILRMFAQNFSNIDFFSENFTVKR